MENNSAARPLISQVAKTTIDYYDPHLMSILSIILLCFGALLIAFVLYGMRLPSKWEVRSTAVVNQPSEELYDYLNTIENWEKWTIWNDDQDSSFSFDYKGPTEGRGATQCWKAKGKSGKTCICGGERPTRIDYFFSFGHGGHHMKGVIELKPRGTSTEVQWVVAGDAGTSPARRIMARMMTPYMQKDFDRSLERLQSLFA